MTNPKITATHGFLHECDSSTNWTASPSANVAGGDYSIEVLYTDVFKIKLTYDDADTEEFVHYYYPTTGNVNVDTTIYNRWVARYKTDALTSGAGARIALQYTDDTVETLLATGSTAVFSAGAWTWTTGTITQSKVIKKIRLYAAKYPFSLAGPTTEYVYYDFALIHKDLLTFPYVRPGGIRLIIPNRITKIPIPSRIGDITQNLGSESAKIHIWGTMDTDSGWRGSAGAETYGLDLYNIAHGMGSEPWQWFMSDIANMKVTLDNLEIGQETDIDAQRIYDIMLSEKRNSDAANETYRERFGI